MTYRRIWEQHNNQKIPKGWHIHHKDGNHANNDPQNLHCCSPEEHWRIHLEQGDVVALGNNKFIINASKSGSHPRTDDVKLAISQNMTGNKNGFKPGYVPWNKGLKLEGNLREKAGIDKMAVSKRGKPLSEFHKEQISRGRKKSPATVQ